VLVYAPSVQIDRTVARDGCTREDAERRVAQLPIDEKRARADHVIDNGGPPTETERQVRALFARSPRVAAAHADVSRALESFSPRDCPTPMPRVGDVEAHTEGFSAETFSFTAEVSRGTRVERAAWVLKREPAAGLLEPYDLEPEFRVLHVLSDDPRPRRAHRGSKPMRACWIARST
jgi:hypothetical protein